MDDYLIGQIVYTIQDSPDDEQYHYAQRMYVRTFHEEDRDIVDVGICKDERIELYVPMPFDSSRDLRVFMDENCYRTRIIQLRPSTNGLNSLKLDTQNMFFA
ncbi:MAG: hypothetical protein FWC16_04290 [Defluviitaleaceae bacterium]|nr:hypothetical protein [Defluviitaleaceae bacterium]MCL2274126.1 hypothetical protein [Defluviitaleaceae bacterium]